MTQSHSKIRLSMLMAGTALALSVTGPLAAQEPLPSKPAGTQKEIADQGRDDAHNIDTIIKKLEQVISKKPVITGPVDDELRKLLLDRRDTATRRTKALRGYYEEGRLTNDKVYDGIFRVLVAQLELADNADEQVPILELRLELAKEVEACHMHEITVGRGSDAEVEEARYNRLGAEIDLLRAKRKRD